jgi:CRISPR-associated protein Cas1
MRKLLNTLYITKQEAYLSLDGENVVMLLEGKEAARLPLTNIENIVCMNYPGCSPALMGKCAENQIGLCFISPSGKFLARVT